MSERHDICPSCGNAYIYENETQCDVCAEQDEREARLQELDALMLEDVTTLEELKSWIKEYLLK